MNDKEVVIFCDFDGTVTRGDVVDLMLETFAEPEWRKIEELWVRGEISSRECLDRQMRCVRATESQLSELISAVDIDHEFEALAVWARRSGIPLLLFSDGFDWMISQVLARHGIDADRLAINVFASHLEFRSGRLQWSFPFSLDCPHGCGTCKPALMRKFAGPGRRILIGDGRSDSAAAQTADLVFAKGWLKEYCSRQEIPHQSFESLGEVIVLSQALELSVGSVPRRGTGRIAPGKRRRVSQNPRQTPDY